MSLSPCPSVRSVPPAAPLFLFSSSSFLFFLFRGSKKTAKPLNKSNGTEENSFHLLPSYSSYSLVQKDLEHENKKNKKKKRRKANEPVFEQLNNITTSAAETHLPRETLKVVSRKRRKRLTTSAKTADHFSHNPLWMKCGTPCAPNKYATLAVFKNVARATLPHPLHEPCADQGEH